jgi:hypothetical protein
VRVGPNYGGCGKIGRLAELLAFGLADVTPLEAAALGGGIRAAVPESDLYAADGALAAIHLAATKPVPAAP